MAGVKFGLPGDGDVERIHEASCRILAEVGVDVGLPGIADQLVRAGARRGSGEGRICLDETMIRDALGRCPSEFDVSSVRGDRYHIGGSARQYSTCCVDPGMNSETGQNRPPRLQDCADNARIIDSLDLITMPYKMDVSYEDVPDQASVLRSNEAFFSNCTKHVICGPCNVSDARTWMEMCEIMAPGPLPKNPIVSALISPSSPLTLHRDCLEMLGCVLEYGTPIICLPCPLCGETSPLSVAGTVVTLNAENLALITVIQMLRPGNPVVYHTVGMPADMRSGAARLSAPEKMFLGLAAAQMGSYYKLPSGTASSATDVSVFDVQNGAESMYQILLGVLGPAHLLTGIGSNSNACGTSAEQILIDCELLRLAEHIREGMRMEHLDQAVTAIARVGPGGQFLSDEHTAAQCRTGEFFEPDLLDWAGGGGMHKRAQERAKSILDSHRPAAPEDRLAALHVYVERRIAGVSSQA